MSIYWKSLGLGETVVGLLWSWGVVTEIVMFMFFTRLLGNRSTSFVLLVAALGALVRWMAFPLIWPLGARRARLLCRADACTPSRPALVLIGVQKLIAETGAEERTGAAQGLAYFTNGMSMALVTLASGPLYERFGVNGFYVMAAVAAFGDRPGACGARSAPKFGLGR